MVLQESAVERDEYRLVLVKSDSRAIWIKHKNHHLRLPRIVIPRWTRRVEQVQKIVDSAWDIRAIVLEILPGTNGHAPCAVIEVNFSQPHDGLVAANVNEISEEELTIEERTVVNPAFADNAGARGPFARLGWIQEAKEWICVEVGYDIAFTGEVHQCNASPTFTLARFATKVGRGYWLKATGEPNVHEFHITRQLAELCPEYLPRQIAAREDWNAWLSEDAGQPLDLWTLPALEQAVVSMATLQQTTIERTSALLVAGAFDQRICVLSSHLVELFEYLDDAMAHQTSTKVSRIESRRLRQLAAIIEDACFHMEALNIPDAVVHNDVNSGNILFEGDRCVFTDWCEVGIGNPFFTFQYLCLLQPGGEDWTPGLRTVYGQCWLEILSASQIKQAFALTPLLATFSCIYGRGTWLNSARRTDPRAQAYARSLARRMEREAQAPSLLEVLCH